MEKVRKSKADRFLAEAVDRGWLLVTAASHQPVKAGSKEGLGGGGAGREGRGSCLGLAHPLPEPPQPIWVTAEAPEPAGRPWLCLGHGGALLNGAQRESCYL